MAESRSPHLGPHYDSDTQQFSAAKLGMWLFLATELLLFGGLFCAYAVYRGSHPEVFEYGAHYLDTKWGAINTIVLLLSSFTMAMAVRAAQCNKRRELVLYLSLTLVCAVDFLGVKFIEYSHKFHENLVWGTKLYEDPHPEAHAAAPEPSPTIEIVPGDPEKGRELFGATCAACHGRRGQGMQDLGPDLRDNKFVAEHDERDMLLFLIRGRPLTDPANTTGLVMPARGGNPFLTDSDLLDIIAHVRTLTKPDANGAQPEAIPTDAEAEILNARSIVPRGAVGPAGLAEPPRAVRAAAVGLPHVDLRHDPNRPANLHTFFGIYFCMTGLHGLHVLAGIFAIGWLRKRAVRGDFDSNYFTPVDLGALYWHVVDIIWIFLFPLLYLID